MREASTRTLELTVVTHGNEQTAVAAMANPERLYVIGFVVGAACMEDSHGRSISTLQQVCMLGETMD